MNKTRKSGFTLIELLMVISIIGILSALGLSVARNAEQDAYAKRTQAGIERISQMLSAKLEENFYRVLPVRIDPTNLADATPENIRNFRKRLMAEFLRVEFPTTIAQTVPANFPSVGDFGGVNMTDYSPVFGPNDADKPQIIHRYNAKLAGATTQFQDAECLYAILSLNRDGHGSAFVETLRDREIGDIDGDGFKEVLDAFGDPLNFRFIDEAGNAIDPNAPEQPQNYRFEITSVNLPGADGQSVATQ